MNKITAWTSPVEWACLGKDAKPSPLGCVVAEILSAVFRGLHHIDQDKLQKVEWANPDFIAINFQNQQFATTDFNELTQLVVMAHDACVRLSVASPAMKTIRLTFHPRKSEGKYTERQETLESAAEEIRKSYTIAAQ